MRRLNYFVVVLLALLCFAAVSMAQQGGTIVGTVADPTGAVVPNATVTVTDTATGVSRSTTTNGSGAYQFPNIVIGTYNVTVAAPGFKTYSQTGITLNVAQTQRVDATLQIGRTSENITVSAEALAIQTETNEQSNLITSTEISNLATNGRNVIGLAALGTGVSSALPSFNQPTSVTADQNISFNGQRPEHNIWLIDGGEDYDRGSGGAVSIMPSQNAIEEFRVLTSNYSADYGFASGGTVSMVLKSGGKDFHGQAWEFDRNNFFDANNYIANMNGQPVPELRYNVYGYNLSGPIYIPGHLNSDRNKLFFFWNQEWRSDIQGVQSSTINDPTAAERSGVFTSPIIDPTTGKAFPTNAAGQYVIPTSRINPQSTALLATGIFPLPTSYTATGEGQYSSAPAEPLNVREEILRIDYNPSEKWAIMGHFIDDLTNQNFATSIWSGDNVPTVGSQMHSPSYSGVIRITRIISPSAVNEFTAQYDGNRLQFSPTGLYANPGSVSIPQYFSGDALNRLPNVSINGTYGIAYQPNWQPWYNAYNSYQAGDDITITKGNHNMKFGGSYMWFDKNQDGFNSTEGSFTFDGSATGNAMADFLLGDAANYSEATDQPRIHTAATGFGVYGLDNWHVNSRLTLNLGLRYEGLPQTRVLDNGVSDFYPNLYNTANMPAFTSSGALASTNGSGALNPGFAYIPGTSIPYYANGLGTTGQPGIPRQFVNNDWNNWGPRVGFAWDLAGNGKTVIRSGFGMFYERVEGNDLYDMIGNPPFAATPSANDVLLSNPSVNYLTGATATIPVFPAGLGEALSRYAFKTPTAMEWSFNLQQQLGKNAVASLAYVGNEDYHQPGLVNINTAPFGSAYQTAVAAGAPTSSSFGGETDYMYPGYSSIPDMENVLNAHYESLQASLNLRSMKGLSLQLGYTWSRVIDYMDRDIGGNSNGQTMDNQTWLTDPFNFGYDYGPGDFNRDQILTLSWEYDLPFLRHSNNGFLKTAVGGWEFSGVCTAETGFPITVYMPNGNSVGLGTNDTANRPNVIGSVTYPQTFSSWFNAADLGAPANGTFGDLGRGALYGPGRANLDISLMKKFAIGLREGANLEFRADAFNVFNHTQFASVGTTYGQSNLGEVTSVYDPRVLQLGATLTF